MPIQKITIFFLALCVPLTFFLIIHFKNLSKSRSLKLYNIFWISFNAIFLFNSMLQVEWLNINFYKILFFVVGLMTTESTLYVVLGKKQKEAFREKRKSVMQKIPWLGAFVFLSVFNEIGMTAAEWLHWASHIFLLIIFFMIKNFKGFFLYSISTILITLFYIFENQFNLWTYFPVVFSIATIFVNLAMINTQDFYDKNISSDSH